MSAVRTEKAAIICAVLLLMSGTQGAKAQTPEELAVDRALQYQSAMQECKKRFPTYVPTTIVATVDCFNRAQAIVLPNFGSNRDLVQTFMADRAVMAERIQNKKMTVAEGWAWLAEKWSQLNTEMQRRNADAAVAQQKAAEQQRNTTADALMWASMFQGLRPTPPPAPAPMPNVRLQTTCMQNGSFTFCH
jgi:hypothetical protein